MWLSEAADYSFMRGIHSPFTDAQLEMIAPQIAQFSFTSRRAENEKPLDSHFLARFFMFAFRDACRLVKLSVVCCIL